MIRFVKDFFALFIQKHNNALRQVAAAGELEKVRELLDRGADLHLKNDSGHTALQWTSMTGHEKVIKLLSQPKLLKDKKIICPKL